MKKLKALLLSLTLGLTAIGCALPASDVKAETSETTTTAGVTMYRLYNPNSGEHFYTKDATEQSNLVKAGWSDEGIGWIAPEKSNTPVYRLYNENAGDHHYTLDAKERDNLISVGWKDEGTGWYSDDDKTVPLYREYNPNAVTGTHNYTTDKAEHDGLVKAGWKDEGIGWYAIGDGKNDPPKKPDESEFDDSLPILPDRIENGYDISFSEIYLYDWEYAKLNYLDEYNSSYLSRDEAGLKNNMIGRAYSDFLTDFNTIESYYDGKHYPGLESDEYLSPGEKGRFVILRWFRFKADNDKKGWAVCYVDVINDSVDTKTKRDCRITRFLFEV